MNNPKNKNTIILLAVLIAVFVYMSKNVVFDIVFGAPDSEVDVANERVVALVNKVNSINFDLSVFDEPKFENFVDFSSPLPSVSTGRENPFSSFFRK